jgi:hypothetical protein
MSRKLHLSLLGVLLLVTVTALAQPDPLVFSTATQPADEAGIPLAATEQAADNGGLAGDDTESDPLTEPVADDSISAATVNALFDRWTQTNNLTYFVLVVVVIVGGYGLYRSSPPETKSAIKKEVTAGAGTLLNRLRSVDLVPGTAIDEDLFEWLYQKFEARRAAESVMHAQAVGRAGTATARPITPVAFTPSGSPLYPPAANPYDDIGAVG